MDITTNVNVEVIVLFAVILGCLIFRWNFINNKGIIETAKTFSETPSTNSPTSKPINREAVKAYETVVSTEPSSFTFPIFVGGPSKKSSSECAKLREKLINELIANDFEVYRGEDKDLEKVGEEANLDAQQNEMSFIKEQCRSVILIATSPGSFCELGLFSWHYASNDDYWFGRNRTSFYALIDAKYENDKSYINEGPIKALKLENAKVHNVKDFEKFNTQKIIQELKRRRAIASQEPSAGRSE